MIFSCLVITALSALGFLNLKIESRAEKLWIPPDSPYINDKQWLDIHFPRNTRHHSALFVAENGNILTPEYLLQMLVLHKNVTQIKAENNKSWNDLCYRIPIANIFLTRRKRQVAINPNHQVVVNTSTIVLAVQNITERVPKLINDDLTEGM